MNFKYKISTFLVLFCSILFVGCNATSTPDPDKQALLVGKNWMLTASTVTPAITVNGVATTDFYSSLASTVKDDILVFTTELFSPTSTNFIMRVSEGATRVLNAPDEVSSGYWAFGTPNSTNATSTIAGPKGWGADNKNFFRSAVTKNQGVNVAVPSIVIYNIYSLDSKTLQVGYTVGTSYYVNTYTAQ